MKIVDKTPLSVAKSGKGWVDLTTREGADLFKTVSELTPNTGGNCFSSPSLPLFFPWNPMMEIVINVMLLCQVKNNKCFITTNEN